jgi:hypothetical protein
MHLSVARVMHEHDAIKSGGLDHIPDVFERALGRVISVNQDELDLPVEAVQPGAESLMAIPWMKRDVGKALSIRRESQIEAVNVALMQAQTPQRPTGGRPDLNSRLGLQAAQHALDRRSLAEGHLPMLSGKDLHHRLRLAPRNWRGSI